jgi:putative transposase
MIDHTHTLPITRQAELLGISRGTAYYLPQPVSPADLALMRRIDELHLEYPWAGARMLRDCLRRDGHRIGRKHVRTLMQRMGIEPLYRKPNTSKRHPRRHAPLSSDTSTFTIQSGRTVRLHAAPPMRRTSTSCRYPWRHNPSRNSI